MSAFLCLALFLMLGINESVGKMPAFMEYIFQSEEYKQ